MLKILLNTRQSVVVMENGALKYGSNNNNNEIIEEKVVSTSLASLLDPLVFHSRAIQLSTLYVLHIRYIA